MAYTFVGNIRPSFGYQCPICSANKTLPLPHTPKTHSVQSMQFFEHTILSFLLASAEKSNGASWSSCTAKRLYNPIKTERPEHTLCTGGCFAGSLRGVEVAREEEAAPGDLSSDAPGTSGPSEGSPDPSGLGRPPTDCGPLNAVILRGCAVSMVSPARSFCPDGPGGLCPVAWVFFCRVLFCRVFFCWVVFCKVFFSGFGRRFGAFSPAPMPALKFRDV